MTVVETDLDWTRRDAVITDARTGQEVFRQNGVEVPAWWSENATNILAQKYFAKGETSLKQVVERVTDWLADRADFPRLGLGQDWLDALKALIYEQKASFNSPVWFNIGVDDGRKQQASACYILAVDDTMDSILEWYRQEGLIFKGGSGSGVNLSNLRGSEEALSGGGHASGPVTFMRGADASAGTIKSGGVTRRAAKMVCLDGDHPDVEDFIWCKAKEERKARVLRGAGFDMDLGGTDAYSLQYQNANNSVRLPDAFMRAAYDGKKWALRARRTGEILKELDAKDLLHQIAQAAWECADPGVMFTDMIDAWHTVPASGPIRATNPCLRRGTRLLTKEGWLLVEDLVGRSVQIYDGQAFVEGEVWCSGVKPVVRLHANDGRTIDVTPDHRIGTISGEWEEARNCVGESIPRQPIRDLVITGTSELPVTIVGRSGRDYGTATTDLMQALGFIQGDGTASTGNRTMVHFTPAKDGEFVREVIMPILRDIADTDTDGLDGTGTKNAYTLGTSRLATWLREMDVAQGSLPTRALPTFVWTLSQEPLCAFLSGLFGANGTVITNKDVPAVRLVSTCHEMLQELQLLLAELGIYANITSHGKPGQPTHWANGDYVSKPSWHLSIQSRPSIEVFRQKINFPQAVQQAKLATIRTNRVGTYYRNSSIIEVEDLGISDEVYDFRVPTTSMGIANGLVVHNCGEFVHLNNTACNLASINLLKYVKEGRFDTDGFQRAVEMMITAQELLVNSDYPTVAINETTKNLRPLGLGYTNLGAALMTLGLPYDSDQGRSFAAGVTALMTGTAYKASADMAHKLGPFAAYSLNKGHVHRVLEAHATAARKLEVTQFFPYDVIGDAWGAALYAAGEYGVRNSQVTVIAPTGTISFLMDADTTGIEPDLGLVKMKKLADGGTMRIVNQAVTRALLNLGYADSESIVNAIHDGVPLAETGIKDKHLAIFATSMGTPTIAPEAHVKMVAAVTPFLSGSVSKTVNLPETATVEDIEGIYKLAWKLGCKNISVYRDNCKVTQPLQIEKREEPKVEVVTRRKLAQHRKGQTFHFALGGTEGYVTTGEWEDGTLGEVFIKIAKQGSTLGGVMDAFAIAISVGLQHGVPLKTFCKHYLGQRFEPAGFTNDADIKLASSLVDYIFKRLAVDYLSVEERQELGIATTTERLLQASSNGKVQVHEAHGDLCATCGSVMIRAGSCLSCGQCGSTTGCA